MFVIVTVPVWVVTVPAKAAARSVEFPDKATLVVKRVISPVVTSLIAFNSARV